MNTDSQFMHLQIHVKEIERKSSMVLASVAPLNEFLNKTGVEVIQPIFFHLHCMLFNSAAVSLSFWPVRNSSKPRGEKLRSGFKCSNEIDYLKDRKIRNHIAHYDERIDDWFENSSNRNIAHGLLGPRNSIGGDSIESSDIFDHYVPDEKTYIFRGDEYDIQKLVQSVSVIHERAKTLGEFAWWDDRFQKEFCI